MSRLRVVPLTKNSEVLDRLPEGVRKSAKRSIGKMPTIYVAYNDETVAAVGFRYRRQSHSCELTWWAGRDEEALKACVVACIMQARLEGRRRIEAFVEKELPEGARVRPAHERGGTQFVDLLLSMGFEREGSHTFFTKYYEDVDVLSSSILDSYRWETCTKPSDVEADFVLGLNDTTRLYRDKNTELYKKNLEYYQEVLPGKTLSDLLEEEITEVRVSPNVSLIPNWHPTVDLEESQ